MFGILTGIAVNSPKGDAAASLPSTQASRSLDLLKKEFPSGDDGQDVKSLQLVIQTVDGASAVNNAEISHLLTQAKSLSHVQSVSDPFDATSPYVSADGDAVVADISYGEITDEQAHSAYEDVLKLAESAPSSLRVEVGGAIVPLEIELFGPGEAIGLVAAFLVLIINFGSLRAAGANMLVAITGVAVGAVGILSVGIFMPLQSTTLTLAIMLGLAVGIDYSLFILSRFRTELKEGRSITTAIGRATGTAGTAVVFAGLTVIIALAGLSVVQISFITEMGLAGSFSVLIAVLLSLTLLPVLLRTLGYRALSKRDRVALNATTELPTSSEKLTFLEGWATTVVKRPFLAILASVLVLGVVAIPMASMKTAQDIPGGIEPDSTQRSAYNLVVDEFGGVQSPLMVLASGDDVVQDLTKIQARLSELDGSQAVYPAGVNATGDVALFSVIPTGGPIDDSTKELVHDIRENADAISGVALEVTGETAVGIDTDEALRAALVQYVILIVVLSFVLLVLMFRSLLVPLIATLGFLLSVGAAFGATVAIFQWGWLDPVIMAPQGDPMLSMLPIILVGVLFGLAMDYQVFLGSRIQEAYRRGYSPKEAILHGFSTSAPVLVAAATIMAVVFAGFTTAPMAITAVLAFGLFVGVVADAFIVRMILVPALLALLGHAAWWLPDWLARILPNLDVEGHALDDPAGVKDGERVLEPS
ncbi:MMPL family transporter [Paenarthrobacter nicotinovorans]|uniref:MMPL family transporter n=1 Tax=Paenarthrobacter nicotinovorans TaxID=29320 RepID=UPI003748D823